MDGQKAIINKILDDAKEKAKAIDLDAKAKCEKKITDAKAWAEEYDKEQSIILNKEIEGIISGKILNAELDVKKATLSAKREVLDKAFSLAYEKLCKVDKKDYLRLIESLIESNADDGDEIILSSDGVLSENDFDGKFSGRGLTVSKKRGEFKGGVILIGKTSDKDLTFASLIESKKEELIYNATKILF